LFGSVQRGYRDRSARDTREYFISDLYRWKEQDTSGAAFERLLRDLKAESGDKADAQPAPYWPRRCLAW
jgi:hypothetical protein